MGTFIHLDFTSIELKLIAGKHAQRLAIANNVDRVVLKEVLEKRYFSTTCVKVKRAMGVSDQNDEKYH